MLGFLAYNPVDALGAMELPHGEFLLVFNTLGVYVDMQGRKSRDREIMYPAVPTVSHPSLLHSSLPQLSYRVILRFIKPLAYAVDIYTVYHSYSIAGRVVL